MANYPQELAQNAVCQSHTGHMTGLWFLPAQPLRLNTNEWMNNPYINIDPLNAKLNPICHLLILLRAHHMLHISRVRVNKKNYTICFHNFTISELYKILGSLNRKLFRSKTIT